MTNNSIENIIQRLLKFTITVLTGITILSGCFDDNFKDDIQKEGDLTEQIRELSNSPVPGDNGMITFLEINPTSIKLSWMPAVDGDNKTPQDQLRYKVIVSENNDINTITDVEKNGTSLMDWTADINNTTAYNLKESTMYYFNVIVKDADNFKSVYLTGYTKTADPVIAEGPVPGDDGYITVTDIATDRATLSWESAVDEDGVTPQDDLEYKLVKSESNDIYTVPKAIDNGETVIDWTQDLTEQTVTELNDSTIYYFNVIVRDSDGLKDIYLTAFVITNESPIDKAPVPGNDGFISVTDITTNSIKLTWNRAIDGDGITLQNELQYKVVKSNSNDIYTVANAENCDDIEMDWNVDVTELTITGLTDSTLYYFNVLVKDGDDLKSIYLSTFVITDEPLEFEAPVPGNGGFIIVSDITTNSVKLTWQSAVDGDYITPENELEYKVVKSAFNDIYTVPYVESCDDIEIDWTADLTELIVIDLNESTLYYFNVIVRDSDGLKSVYLTNFATTLEPENETPIPGANGIITSSGITASSVDLFWNPATDSDTPQNDLIYKVVKSEYNNIDSVESVEGSTNIVTDWTRNITSTTASDLDESHTYFFNIIVKDGDDKKSVYSTISITTSGDVIYMFNAGQHTGDMVPAYTASVRNDLDTICSDAKSNSYPTMPCSNIRAFISISESDEIADMTGSPMFVPSSWKIKGPENVQIANDWAGLLDGDIDEKLADADIVSDQWWSGSKSDGKLYVDDGDDDDDDEGGGTLNCGDWTSSSGKGRTGHHNFINGKWISKGSKNCNTERYLLCVCW